MVSIEEIKFKYYNSYLDECQALAEELAKDKSHFDDYCLAQFYLIRCLFEKSQIQIAKEKFNILSKEIRDRKGENVDEIDIFMQITYQQHLYNLDLEATEENNCILLKFTQNYKDQNENQDNYVKGLYLYGLGLYKFFENFREQSDIECVHILKQALDEAPQYKYEIINSIGMVLYDKGLYQESIEYTEQMYKDNNRLLGFANNLAFLYAQINQHDKAEELYLEALNLNPQNTVILNNISHFYFNYKVDKKKAISYLYKSYEINPEDSDTLYRLGYYLYIQNYLEENQEMPSKGIEFLEKSIQFNQFSYKSYICLCSIEVNKHNYEQATKYLKDLSELKPKSGYILFQIAEQYQFMQQYEKAIDFYQQSLKFKLSTTIFLECHDMLSSCYYQIQQHEKSLEIQLQAINYKDFKEDVIQNDIMKLVLNLERRNNNLSDYKKLEIINSFYGPIQKKLHIIHSQIIQNKEIKKGLFLKMQQFNYTLLLLAYNKQIIPFLKYQNEISHWDLYID
ncbi:tetratricopeptide repeat protein (macronuclear) [Tetrahymena thermophila SB210]|uniref:Tetratricopeptide repeat protein n=1 Tax=Tetrahymena thermophila (strain SB210) TaxID=312017 RepID=Q247X5_TETTS|nr:tetratricopeptide repeat protein [Tetrahymena thermophila SB210]EAS04170.2 tetratricopeptide repeat protein [Tetrahymena thermophila SB210]|eukprot:XP_001024415.2 tetratricopeptide repeat protein [Tetrahymena thermophila SB210]